MASDSTKIANLALQMLGAERITSMTQAHKNARACLNCYEQLRDAELRKHTWSFSKAREVLAADVDEPAFDFDYQYTWPATAVRVIRPGRSSCDWVLEGRKILTNEGDSIDLEYVAIKDPAVFDPMFVIALAASMAMFMCEEITQSNQKKADALAAYKDAVREARRINALERGPVEPPEDTWVEARR